MNTSTATAATARQQLAAHLAEQKPTGQGRTYGDAVAVARRELDALVESATDDDARDVIDALGTHGLLSVPFPPRRHLEAARAAGQENR